MSIQSKQFILPLKTHTFSDTEEAALISLIAESKRFISTVNPILFSKYDREVQQLKKISEVVNCFGRTLFNYNSSSSQNSSDLLIKRISLYKQIELKQQQKIKSLTQETLAYIKALSSKDQEIDSKEAQIFELKQKLQSKQKIILKIRMDKPKNNELQAQILVTSKIDKESVFKQRNDRRNEKNHRQNEILGMKSKTNDKQPDQKKNRSIFKINEINSSPFKAQQMASSFIQHSDNDLEKIKNQNSHLLKIIKEKDMKIYELIQELKYYK